MPNILEKLIKLENEVDAASCQVQKNISKHLDGLYFRVMSGTDFDTEKEGDGHYDEQLTFVIRDEDTIELWKGDVQVSSSGGSGKKRAVMYAIDPNGWDFKLSDTYEEETTTHGTTYVITPVYDGNGLLTGGPYIIPAINIKKPTNNNIFTANSFTTNMFNDPGFRGILFPTTDFSTIIAEHQQAAGANTYETLVTPQWWLPQSINEITELNKSCYDTMMYHIKRTQDSVITDETVFDWDEYILLRIFIGCMYGHQNAYYRGNQLYNVTKTWDSGAMTYTMYSKPCIHIRRFAGNNPPSGYSPRSLIQEGYFYLLNNGIGDRGCDSEIDIATNSNWKEMMGYGIGLWRSVNQENFGYTLEFGGSGLVPLYGNDLDTHMELYNGRAYPFFNNNIKPRVGMIIGGTRAYSANDSVVVRRLSESLLLLTEKSGMAERLGFDYDLDTGARLPNWALDTEGYRYNALTFDILKRKNERGVE